MPNDRPRGIAYSIASGFWEKPFFLAPFRNLPSPEKALIKLDASEDCLEAAEGPDFQWKWKIRVPQAGEDASNRQLFAAERCCKAILTGLSVEVS